MSKNKAVIVAVVMVLLALFVVIAVTSVMKDDSHERYGQLSSEEQSAVDDSAVAPASVKDESTQPLAQNEVGGVNETATEHMEDTQEAVPETVVEEDMEATADAATDTANAVEEKATEMADDAKAAAAGMAEKAEDMAENAKQATTGGEIHIVTAQGLKYNPLVTTIQPGDTVAWENMPTHDTQSLEGLIPEGAEYWHSPLGENFQRTFTVEGIYVYKCTPHFGAGMGGAIIVGKPVNLDVIKAADAKGAAGRLVRKAIAAAEQM